MKFLTFLALAVFTLTGCVTVRPGVDSESSPSSSYSSSEQAFLDNAQDITGTEGMTDAEVLAEGENSCKILDMGVTLDEFVTSARESGMDPGYAGGMMGAAVRDLCPEYQSDMDAYLRSVQ